MAILGLCVDELWLLQTSSHVALVRCFQLAFSLRSISLDQEGKLNLLVNDNILVIGLTAFIWR
jgi:hypothetical protein